MNFGVYLLISNHIVVYVGQTCRIEKRIAHHKSVKIKVFDRYHFFKCPAEHLNWFEEDLIERFRPVYNKQSSVKNIRTISNVIVREIGRLKKAGTLAINDCKK